VGDMPRPFIQELDLRNGVNGHALDVVSDRLNAVPGFKTSAGQWKYFFFCLLERCGSGEEIQYFVFAVF
jgi:hypothetical protein